MIEIKISRATRNEYGVTNTNIAWQWCVDKYGPPEPNGKRWAWNTIRTFWFYDEKDAVLFALRWS